MKKVRVFKDPKGLYIRSPAGKKIRIVTKKNHKLTERELIKFLIQHLKPKRRKGDKKRKETVQDPKMDASMVTTNAILKSALVEKENKNKF